MLLFSSQRLIFDLGFFSRVAKSLGVIYISSNFYVHGVPFSAVVGWLRVYPGIVLQRSSGVISWDPIVN